MLDADQVSRYLARISADRPSVLDAAALRTLHERHLLSVPFETIDYHRGEEIHMDERVLDKIVARNRGGGCSEIAVGFHMLLEGLGFDATLHQARVRLAGSFTPPYNHAVTTVDVDGSLWLVDVGWGRSNRYPLRLGTEETQRDPHGDFVVCRPDDEDGANDVYRDRELQYRFYDEPIVAQDGNQVLWWYRTSPQSPFLQSLSCSLPTETGWAFMKSTAEVSTLVLTDGRNRRIEKLKTESEILDAYAKHFGIELTEPPAPSRYLNTSMRMSYEDGSA